MNPYFTLKAAFRELVDSLGGCTRAAKATRPDAQRISRYGSIHEAMHAPIDAVLDLEQAAIAAGGEPLVTRALAEHHGFNLVPKCGADDVALDFTRHLGAVAKETGEAVSSLATAIADGTVTPMEAQACIAEAEDAQRKLACLIDDLKGIADKAPIPLRRQA
jgi:hypothetical protein